MNFAMAHVLRLTPQINSSSHFQTCPQILGLSIEQSRQLRHSGGKDTACKDCEKNLGDKKTIGDRCPLGHASRFRNKRHLLKFSIGIEWFAALKQQKRFSRRLTDLERGINIDIKIIRWSRRNSHR
jgi:hypothetical protein